MVASYIHFTISRLMLFATEAKPLPEGCSGGIACVAANTSQDQSSDQAVLQASARTQSGQWKKSVSGNPKGSGVGKAIIEAKEKELYTAICSDLGGNLSPFENALVVECSRMMAKASVSTDDALRCRLINSSTKMIDKIRAVRRERAPVGSALDRHLAGLR
jgi:hypothetical protein